MSVRRLKIGIRSPEERRRALKNLMGHVGRRQLVPQDSGLYFESVEELRRILTAKRLELILAIVRHRPASVHELAVLVDRDYKNVSEDIALLARLGLVSLTEGQGKGRPRAPLVPYDKIQVTIDLRQSPEARAA